MWIKKRDIVVNTDNVCAIHQQGCRVVFRFAGTSSPGIIERCPLSSELVMKGMPEDTVDKIWKALSEGVTMLEL